MMRYATRLRTVGLEGFRGDDYLALVVRTTRSQDIATDNGLTITVPRAVYGMHHYCLCHLLHRCEPQC